MSAPDPQRVRDLLAEAGELEERARQRKVEAGAVLYALKTAQPGKWQGRCGISRAMEEHLIQMARGGARFVKP